MFEIVATAVVATAAFADDLIIAAPAFAVGDTWEFEGTENGKPYRWSREVLEVMPDSRLRVRATRNGKESIEFYDSAMNFLVAGRLDGRRLLVQYPLAVGKAWTYTIDWDNPNAATTGRAAVVAHERIAVKSGSYDCLKVDASNSYGVGRSYVSYDTNTRWYCPDIKWAAKEITSAFTASNYGPQEDTRRETNTELVRFVPGK